MDEPVEFAPTRVRTVIKATGREIHVNIDQTIKIFSDSLVGGGAILEETTLITVHSNSSQITINHVTFLYMIYDVYVAVQYAIT